MSGGIWIILILSTSGLILLTLVIMGIFLYRMSRRDSSDQSTEVVQTQSHQPGFLEDDYPLSVMNRPFDSIITRLSFMDSLDPQRFADVNQVSALNYLNETLAANASAGVVFNANSVRLNQSGAEMIVSASKNGKKLLQQGKVVIIQHSNSGRTLAILKDPDTGKIIDHMKGVGNLKNAASKLTALSSVVVGAAHIISGADIAKRLKQIDSKLNLLLALRRIEQFAKLERIYSSAKELLYGTLTPEKRWELWRLRGDVRELRSCWRRELEHKLDFIDDPNEAHWFKQMFTRKKTTDRSIQGKITEGQMQIGMMEYALRLDQVLAVSSGTTKEFERSLNDELIELERVSGLLREKAYLISGKYPELTVDSTVEGLNTIVEQYRSELFLTSGNEETA